MSEFSEIQLLLQSFERNGRVNQTVLEAFTERALELSDGYGASGSA